MVTMAQHQDHAPDGADVDSIHRSVIDPRPTQNLPVQSPASLLYLATVPAPIRNFLIPYAAHFRALGWRVDAAANGGTMVPALRDHFDHVYEIPVSRSVLDARSL